MKKDTIQLEIETQRRFLSFINDAQHPRDLAIPIKALEKNVLRVRRPRGEDINVDPDGKDEDVKLAMDEKMARKIIDARNECSPVYGFLNIEQMFENVDFNFNDWWLNWICILLGYSRNGCWQLLNYQSTVGVAQAALVHTLDDDHKGRVLLIEQVFGNSNHEEDYSRTPLWKPEGTTEDNPFEEYSPHPPGLSPDLAHNTFEPSEGNLYCSAHVFLSDGSLLAVGGGGESGPPPTIANMAWIFDPKLKEWHPTYDKSVGHGCFEKMKYGRWYPTAISLGDDAGRVLIVGGLDDNKRDGQMQMEVYNEYSGKFSLISGPSGEVPDPSLSPITWDYPNLHLLRNGQIFYSRALRNNVDSAPALFSFDGHNTGRWSVLTGQPDSTSSIGSSSALILGDAGEPDRVIHVGGGKGGKTTSNEVRVIEVPPTSSTPWQIYQFPDKFERRRANLVLLPDGTVLIAGGAEGAGAEGAGAEGAGSGGVASGRECYLFDPAQTGGDPFTKVADMHVSRNATHEQVLLLPSAKVATFGAGKQIEIFTPPYLYNAQCQLVDCPKITAWPNPDNDHHILHGQTFTVSSPQAAEIGRVVLVRPMAVTHQMDTEQRVIPLCFTHLGGDELEILVPDGRVYPYSSDIHTHAINPRGMYMLFILDNIGVPSEAKFVLLR